MAIFGILSTPLGWVMKWIYAVLLNYGWTIIVFTILARVLMFPLSVKQQKSTAKTQAYQPMIQEIQKKWANDKNRQNAEMQKFYQENNINMTAGCAPMAVNMLVIFGMIYAIQAPLTNILQIPQQQVDNGIAIVEASPEITSEINAGNNYTAQSILIGDIKENPQIFIDGVEVEDEDGNTYLAAMDGDYVEQIKNFNFEFAGFDLSKAPALNFNKYLILPILSILTMIGSQIFTMKTTPGSQQMAGQMMMMTVVTSLMFGFFAFRVPVGFSLYYTVSNVVMFFQQVLLRKMYDPAKIRADVEAEIEARKAEKKAKKTVKVQDEKGEVVNLDVSDAELNKLRLAKARELDAKRYADEEGPSAEQKQAAEKARQLDEEKYSAGKALPQPGGGTKESDPDEDEDKSEEKIEINSDENAVESKEYKPGRRKRSNQKQKEKVSFAEQERAAEQEKLSRLTEEK